MHNGEYLWELASNFNYLAATKEALLRHVMTQGRGSVRSTAACRTWPYVQQQDHIPSRAARLRAAPAVPT